jgi:transposase
LRGLAERTQSDVFILDFLRSGASLRALPSLFIHAKVVFQAFDNNKMFGPIAVFSSGDVLPRGNVPVLREKDA